MMVGGEEQVTTSDESFALGDSGDDEVGFSASADDSQDDDDDLEYGNSEDDDNNKVVAIVVEEDSDQDEHHDAVGPLQGDDIELGNPEALNESAGSITHDKSRRTSLVADLETGKKGGARAAHALRRSDTACAARNPVERRVRSVRQMFRFAERSDDEEENENGEQEMRSSMHGRLMVSQRNLMLQGSQQGSKRKESRAQYRLQALRPPPRNSRLLRFLGISDGLTSTIVYDNISTSSHSGCCCGLSPNQLVIRYLFWTFRSSFAAVFLSAASVFFGLITLFALGIWSIGQRHPTCIQGTDGDPNAFIDSFQLSWTTFSTVGYGLVHSGISSGEPDIKKCTGITILVTLEAFVGVLFASMCGAILFAKVARIQSYAQVIFSDPIVIRYGSGLGTNETDGDESTESGDEMERIPCPVLEFRLINRLSHTPGGEIMDASVNVVASIDASQACPTLKRAASRRRRGGKKGKNRARSRGSVMRRRGSAAASMPMRAAVPTTQENKIASKSEKVDSTRSLTSLASAFPSLLRSIHQSFEEDPSGHLVPRRIFSKLEVESPDHPFFKRVWMLRHKLDQYSPLLQKRAREMVKENGGFWPRELNNHEGVRSAVLFDQILVSLSGTSNADANSVYAQKVYDFVDVNVGYRFANLLFRDEVDGALHVDHRLINDVMEQSGGGGEPFLDESHGASASEMLIL